MDSIAPITTRAYHERDCHAPEYSISPVKVSAEGFCGKHFAVNTDSGVFFLDLVPLAKPDRSGSGSVVGRTGSSAHNYLSRICEAGTPVIFSIAWFQAITIPFVSIAKVASGRS